MVVHVIALFALPFKTRGHFQTENAAAKLTGRALRRTTSERRRTLNGSEKRR